MPNPSSTSVATAPYRRLSAAILLCFFTNVIVAGAQASDNSATPSLKVGRLNSGLRIDGTLDEPTWQHAAAIENLTMIGPKEGAAPTGRTIVKVLANARVIVFGIVCEDPDRVAGQPVPIAVAGRLNGRVGDTNVGALVAQTKSVDGIAPAAAMGAFRVKQNVFGESSVGAIATFGDPTGKSGSWLAGADFTYQTSHFRKDKNFLVDVWGLGMGQARTTGDKTAAGFEVGYPNDLLNVTLSYNRIGDAFQPSLGYVQRPATQTFSLVGEYDPRPNFWHIRQMFNEFRAGLFTDLQGRWQTYSIFTAPVNWRFESGDRVEFNWSPAGDNLQEPFEIAGGVFIAPEKYHWTRYRLEVGTATKRRLSSQITWRFGTFYNGTLDQIQVTAAWNPVPLFTVSLNGEHDLGRLKEGDFTTTLVGTRLKFNVSPNLDISSFVQYDTASRSVGTNNRLRWTFRAVGDLFIIYNHNVRDFGVPLGWAKDSNQLLVKLQYAFRY